jgi:hypothetical protein
MAADQRWYMFTNMGPAPSGRSGHAMATWHKKVFVLGGESYTSSKHEWPNMINMLDTGKIKYPSETRSQQANRKASNPTMKDSAQPSSSVQNPLASSLNNKPLHHPQAANVTLDSRSLPTGLYQMDTSMVLRLEVMLHPRKNPEDLPWILAAQSRQVSSLRQMVLRGPYHQQTALLKHQTPFHQLQMALPLTLRHPCARKLP